MIRLGRYDAFDKWEILCRHWQDPSSVGEIGVDKFNRPRLSNWHAVALKAGQASCFEYLRLKSASCGRDGNAIASGEPDAINAEISELLLQIGYDELQTRAGSIAAEIARYGFDTRSDAGLSRNLVDRLREVFRLGALVSLQWTEEVGEIPSLQVLRSQAPQSFPKKAIRHKTNVLSMFCAWFYGRSDVIHIYDARPENVTLVDLNKPSLEEIQLIYPRHWNYVHSDYKEFLQHADQNRLSYDLVVCDPFKDLGPAVAWEALPTIMRLCSDTFITNYFVEMLTELGVEPDDLSGLSRAVKNRTGIDVEFTEMIHRSSAVYWAVMRRR